MTFRAVSSLWCSHYTTFLLLIENVGVVVVCTWLISDRGSHITSSFSRMNPRRFCLVNKLRFVSKTHGNWQGQWQLRKSAPLSSDTRTPRGVRNSLTCVDLCNHNGFRKLYSKTPRILSCPFADLDSPLTNWKGGESRIQCRKIHMYSFVYFSVQYCLYMVFEPIFSSKLNSKLVFPMTP